MKNTDFSLYEWEEENEVEMREMKALFFSVGNLGCGMGECGKRGEGVGESW